MAPLRGSEMPPFGTAWVACMLIVASLRLCACADTDVVISERLPVPTGATEDCPANCSCLKTVSLYCTAVDVMTSFPVVSDDAKADSIVEMLVDTPFTFSFVDCVIHDYYYC